MTKTYEYETTWKENKITDIKFNYFQARKYEILLIL